MLVLNGYVILFTSNPNTYSHATSCRNVQPHRRAKYGYTATNAIPKKHPILYPSGGGCCCVLVLLMKIATAAQLVGALA